MTYDQRLNMAKGLATSLLAANVLYAYAQGFPAKASAEYAIFIFSMFVLFQGLLLCWHNRLFGTGRSVRMAMALTMGICLTHMLTLGSDVAATVLFIAAAGTSILSIRRGKRTLAV